MALLTASFFMYDSIKYLKIPCTQGYRVESNKMTVFNNYTKGLTHGGVFHADDVFTAAILRMINPGIEITRVLKVPEIISEDTIVFDVGYGRYDHHQRDAEVRDNGVKYAAFGLVWRDFSSFFVSSDNAAKFDRMFVQAIDSADNGDGYNPLTGAISAFAPNWVDADQNMDAAFWLAVDFATAVLQREFNRLNAAEQARIEVKAALDQSDGDIVVLDRFVPWQDVLIQSTAKFVVFSSLR